MKNLAKKLKEDSLKFSYVYHGKRRIFNAVKYLKKIIKGGEKILDIGGSLEGSGHGYSFEEYIKSECDVEYHCVNSNCLDMRWNLLPFRNDSFDLVISWETIEHLWIIDNTGQLSWKGVLNFWYESHRVLKPNGTFYVTTRNRVCPFAFRKILHGDVPQCGSPRINRDGHVREFSPEEFRMIADGSKKFNVNEIFSHQSIPPECQRQANTFVPRLEKFLGKRLVQEEKFDTIFFVSKK
tara:strand:+ start:508 stop:1221 length:714 start_codon:yes stop_codon:yes gene_type:complete